MKEAEKIAILTVAALTIAGLYAIDKDPQDVIDDVVFVGLIAVVILTLVFLPVGL